VAGSCVYGDELSGSLKGSAELLSASQEGPHTMHSVNRIGTSGGLLCIYSDELSGSIKG
jgi:hypothetical protein